MKKIIIIGGKGTAVVIAEQIKNAITKCGMDLEILGFAFDDESFGDEINGLPILSKTYNVYEKYKHNTDVFFIYQLYRSDLIKERVKLRQSYGIPAERYINFIHPTATVSESVKMGYGNIVLANNILNPNVEIGSFNTFNSNCLLGHDTNMGDNNFFAAHSVIGAFNKIGSGNFFGLNCSVKGFLEIGNFNITGMASNVVKNVGANKTLVGNPAKEMSKQTK